MSYVNVEPAYRLFREGVCACRELFKLLMFLEERPGAGRISVTENLRDEVDRFLANCIRKRKCIDYGEGDGVSN